MNLQTKPLFLSVVLCLFVVGSQAQNAAYLDPSKPVNERAKDLVSHLTLEEKVAQMVMNTPGIERLDIPPYDWWNEALHGVGRAGIATIFPQAIGMGATFDPELLNRVATAISDEARAMYNNAQAKGYYNRYNGLTFWSPNVNIFRDPRWGRGHETYGEDPYLMSQMGVAFVKGMQGEDPNYLKTAACAKHYVVHSGPEKLRHEFNALASAKDMNETYLPAFKALVDAGVESVMCAYNRTNDEPCCGDNYLLNDLLREEWGFEGHIVSDCWAIVDFYSENGHGVSDSQVEAAVRAANAGVNVNCGNTYPALVQAVEDGLIEESVIDDLLAKLLETRFKLGMFDPEGTNPYSNISSDVINSDKHRQLAREAAQKSIVLLKNNGVLPLRNDMSNYYVTGPNAAVIAPLIGNYFGVNPQMVTTLEGVAGAVEPGSQVLYKQGALLDRENINPVDWNTGAAREADATILVMGLSGLIEGEEGESISSPYFGDRLDYDIPENQINYLKKLKAGHDRPVIAVVHGGSPMNLTEVHEVADAVILAWYPGEEGGNAIADVLFGKVAPSGKLPLTFPQSLDQLPAYEDYTMQGRTYRYMTEKPLYPFGYGLSYTTFEYADIALSKPKIKRSESTELSLTVKNAGRIAAEEVVQLYIQDVEASFTVPLLTLSGFQRINLEPGETRQISFSITPEMLEVVNEEGKSVLEKGSFLLKVGGAAPVERSQELGASAHQEIELVVR